PSCFNKFQFMQSCFFFYPSLTFIHHLNGIDQFFFFPISFPAPINYCLSMFDVDGSWLAIKSHAPPIPQFESEDVRSGADLENHAVGAGAMNSTRRDEQMVMFFYRPFLHIFFSIKKNSF